MLNRVVAQQVMPDGLLVVLSGFCVLGISTFILSWLKAALSKPVVTPGWWGAPCQVVPEPFVHSQSQATKPRLLVSTNQKSHDETVCLWVRQSYLRASPFLDLCLVKACQDPPARRVQCLWQVVACTPGRDMAHTFSTPLQVLARGLSHPAHML